MSPEVNDMQTKLTVAIVSTRPWDDLAAALEHSAQVREMECLAAPADLESPENMARFDVVFLDGSEFDPAANGNGALLYRCRAYGVFVSDRDDPALLRRALRAGGNDVITRPFDEQELADLFERARCCLSATPAADAAPEKEPARVISFFATKGGVGRSVIAANFALALSRLEPQARICLADLDMQFGDLALILNVKPRGTVAELVSSGGPFDEELPNYLAKCSENVFLLAAPARPEEAELVQGAHTTEILDALAARFDYVIADPPAVFNDVALAALDKSDQVFLVSAPVILDLKNLRSVLDVMRSSLEYPEHKIRVVLNRNDMRNGIARGEIENITSRKVDVSVPCDDAVLAASVNEGAPAVERFPKSKFARAVTILAQAAARTQETPKQPAPARATGLKKLFARAAS